MSSLKSDPGRIRRREPPHGRRRQRRLPGRAVDKLSTAWHVLQWHDITDDGRWTEIRGSHITGHPTTPTDLATW
ncbi:hypothetical protein [Nocardia sp. NPDC051463]|uniref:hypothetical protein n=1 Tax=Nocardia sp. NPDC051463 TaxID=3154845 RepID=UPI0034333478